MRRTKPASVSYPRPTFKKVKHSKYEYNDHDTKRKWKLFIEKYDQECEKRAKDLSSVSYTLPISSKDYDSVARRMRLPSGTPDFIRKSPSINTVEIDLKAPPNDIYYQGSIRESGSQVEIGISGTTVRRSRDHIKSIIRELKKEVFGYPKEFKSISRTVCEELRPTSEKKESVHYYDKRLSTPRDRNTGEWATDRKDVSRSVTYKLKPIVRCDQTTKKTYDLCKSKIEAKNVCRKETTVEEMPPTGKAEETLPSVEILADQLSKSIGSIHYSTTIPVEISTDDTKEEDENQSVKSRKGSLEDGEFGKEIKGILSSGNMLRLLSSHSKVSFGDAFNYSDKNLEDFDDMIVLFDENEFKLRQIPSVKKPIRKHYSKKQQMYLKFMKLPKKKIAHWRPKKQTIEDVNEMSLPQRAAYEEDKVSAQFCGWVNSLGGVKTELTPDSLKEMFQIGLVNPASQALCSTMFEYSCLPQIVSQAKGMDQKSFRNVLRRHLNWDAWADNAPEKKVAFNHSLPPDIRVIPRNNNVTEEWFSCKSIPEDTANFCEAFRTILHLRSLQKYCQFLVENPRYKKPKFLVDMKLFDELVWDEEKSRKSFGSSKMESVLDMYHEQFRS